jgi:cysteine desulfurase
MLANNEVGTVTPLAAVAALVAERAPRARLHTDAVQAMPWLDVAALAGPAHLVSGSAHKFGGPKGVGALVVREGTRVEPLLLGGGQERERRSGTHNVAGIVGLAAALAEADAERDAQNARITTLRDRLVDTLCNRLEGVTETVPRDRKVAGSAHVCIEAVESESLLFLLDEAEVCASAASACASGAMEPSHVLSAMGVPRQRSAGALRLTLGCTTNADHVDRAIDVLVESVNRLRRHPDPGRQR